MISTEHTISWPCQYLWPRMRQDERTSLLTQVGLLRFEQKAHLFVEQLRSTVPQAPYDLFSTCLIPALAEALAYGRDRDFFRVVGLRMLGRFDHVPEPLGRASLPSPLDTGRLQALTRLLAQLSSPDIWSSLRALLIPDVIYATNPLQSLRATFMESGLSLARTDILVCNVILPFAYAVALLEHDVALAECAHTLYLHLPGLPANRVTRMMGAQLGLAKAPSGGCQQQGLHYIYQHTCREKRCNVCLLGKYEI